MRIFIAAVAFLTLASAPALAQQNAGDPSACNTTTIYDKTVMIDCAGSSIDQATAASLAVHAVKEIGHTYKDEPLCVHPKPPEDEKSVFWTCAWL